MADQRPRVIGLQDLLRLRKRLPEKPAPLVFSGPEFAPDQGSCRAPAPAARSAPGRVRIPGQPGAWSRAGARARRGRRASAGGRQRDRGGVMACTSDASARRSRMVGGRRRRRVSSSSGRPADFSARAAARGASSAASVSGGGERPSRARLPLRERPPPSVAAGRQSPFKEGPSRRRSLAARPPHRVRAPGSALSPRPGAGDPGRRHPARSHHEVAQEPAHPSRDHDRARPEVHRPGHASPTP